MTSRLGILGGGNMGSAIARGLIAAQVYAADEIIIAEVDGEKRAELERLGCRTTSEARVVASVPVLLLALKPQTFLEVATELGSRSRDTIVISIMAGLSSGVIRRALGGEARILRAMPNVACRIGVGMTAIALGEGAQPGDERIALDIFSTLGQAIVIDESLMYAATAVSGSGPAYVFLLAEAMQRAAGELGFAPDAARTLVEQTVMGAGRLLIESDQGAAAWRKAVTSPGGTTAAAISLLEQGHFFELVVEAIRAARDRGAALDEQ